MLLDVAPHACQQCPKVQSTTASPGILSCLKYTAAVGTATNAQASLWVQTVEAPPLDRGRLTGFVTAAGNINCDCSQLSFKVQVVCPRRFETHEIWDVYTVHLHLEQFDDHLNIAILWLVPQTD